jgi:hypothetical protein
LTLLDAGGDSLTQALTERYGDRIGGVLSCYDRLVITGTLPTVCYAEGMTRYLNARGIRIFDYPDFAKTLRENASARQPRRWRLRPVLRSST